MQWFDKTVQKMKPYTRYTRQEIISLLRIDDPSLHEGSYHWAIGGMLKSGKIIRNGFDEYMLPEGNMLPEYIPSYSSFSNFLMEKISDKYPYVGFTVFETVLMNDFLNHLIARNTVFIQVDKDVSAIIFRFLQEENVRSVLYKPSQKDFNLYWIDNCVVVSDIVSEAPISIREPHVITIEKMLVDIYCDKLIKNTYSTAEYPSIMEQAMEYYKVDKTRMLRYARRRNKATQIEQIIETLP